MSPIEYRAHNINRLRNVQLIKRFTKKRNIAWLQLQSKKIKAPRFIKLEAKIVYDLFDAFIEATVLQVPQGM